MPDPGAIRVNAMLDASPFLGGISGMVGGLSEMSNAMKLGSLAVGYFAFKTLKAATQELVAFEKEAIELKKVMGGDIAEPVIQSVRELSLIMPVARKELMQVAATAARLGVRGKDNIMKFTEVVAKIGIATDVSAGEAAESLARLAKQTKMPISEMEALGAVINQLDNTMATSSSGIIDAASRSAAELSRLGFTVTEIIALNAALAEVSESAPRAGTRLNMFAQEFGNPKKAEAFGKAIRMTGKEFTEFRRAMPLEAMLELIQVMRDGGDVADELASNVNSRVRRALQQFAVNEQGVTHALKEGNEEHKKRASLNREYGENLQLVASKQQIMANNIDNLQLVLGEELRPAIIAVQEAAIGAFQALNKMFTTPLANQLNKESLEELETQLYKLWDERRMHEYFGFFDDHMRNAANWFLESEYHFDTWFSDNQEMQEQISEMMNKISSDVRPVFFELMLQILQDTEKQAGGLAIAFEQITSLATAMEGIDLSQITGDKIAMAAYIEQTQKLIAARRLGVLTETQFRNAMQSTADIAALNAFTLRGVKDEIRDLIDIKEEHQKLVDKLDESLDGQLDKLRLTERQLFMTGDGYKYADKWMKSTMLSRWDLIQQLEGEREAWEKLKKEQESQDNARESQAQSVRDQEVALANEIWARKQAIAGIQDYNRAMLEASMWMTHTPEDRERILGLYDEARALEEVTNETKRLAAEREKAAKQQESRAKQIKAIIDKYSFATFESQLRLFERVVGDAAESIVDTFDALVTGSANAGEAVVEMIGDIAKALLQAQIQKMIFEAFGPMFFPAEFGAANQVASSVVRGTGYVAPSVKPFGAFAAGGRPEVGKLALVGERGPELFVPDAAGTVIPNDQLGGTQEVTVVHNFNINALDGASVRDMLAREQKFISGLTLDTIQRSRRLKRG